MIKLSASSLIALSLAFTAPASSVSADVKDVIIGGVIGATINQAVNNNRQKRTRGRHANRGPETKGFGAAGAEQLLFAFGTCRDPIRPECARLGMSGPSMGFWAETAAMRSRGFRRPWAMRRPGS